MTKDIVNTPYKEPELAAKFEAGNKVNIVSGRMKGSTGIIKEAVKTHHDGEIIYEYHVILDGEKEERIYYEHNLEYEGWKDFLWPCGSVWFMEN